MKKLVVSFSVVVASLLLALPLNAQSHKLTVNFGGGFTEPAFDVGSRLDTGWNVTAGAGYNFSSHFALVGEFNYNRFGINNATLATFQVPNGDASLWSFTANPMVRFNTKGRLGFYLIGGGGVYHLHSEFTAPTVATATAFDPFFGYFFPVTVPANQVLSSYSTTKGGLNIGGGFTFKVGDRGLKIYAESRYHHMFTSGVGTDVLPVTFGLRW